MERDAAHIPFVVSGSYPLRGGNRVTPLVDGEPAFRRICEAVESARASAWLTVAFLDREVQMPDGRGSFFDVLDRAAARGVDVRVIFWRHTLLEQLQPGTHFSGTEEERAWLAARGSRFLARWDQAEGRYCQHQKSWLVDAGLPGETAFIGGINLNQSSVVPPGHPAARGRNTHDVYVEVEGPAASDVHHNFVQRWNEASDRDAADGFWPDAMSQDDLPFPEKLSASRGDVPVQAGGDRGGALTLDREPRLVQVPRRRAVRARRRRVLEAAPRSIRRGRLRDGLAPAGAPRRTGLNGSIRAGYLALSLSN